MKIKMPDKSRVIAIAIAIGVVMSMTLLLPNMQETTRNSRIYLLGIVCMGFTSLFMIKRSVSYSILIAYVAVFLYLGSSGTQGSATYTITILSGLMVAGVMTSDKWVKHKNIVYNAVCGVCLFNATLQLAQMLGLNFPRGIASVGMYGWPGMFGNSNEISIFMAMGLPFFFRRKWAYLIPVMVLGLFLSRTTGGIIAAVVMSCTYLLIKFENWYDKGMVALVIVAMAIAFVSFVDKFNMDSQMKNRGMVWKTTVVAANVKPQGWGFGQYENVMPLLTYASKVMDEEIVAGYILGQVKDKKALIETTKKLSGKTDEEEIREYLKDPRNNTKAPFAEAHNDYLETLFSLGFGGFILGLWFLVSSLVKGFRKADKIPALSLLASAITALFFFPWQIMPLAIFTVLSLTLIQSKEA